MFASLEQLRRQPNSAKADADIGSGCCAQRQDAPICSGMRMPFWSANGDHGGARSEDFAGVYRMVHMDDPGTVLCTIRKLQQNFGARAAVSPLADRTAFSSHCKSGAFCR